MTRTRSFILAALLTLLAACGAEKPAVTAKAPEPTAAGNPEHGKQLIEQYACQSCHAIPALAGPKGMVGPSLEGLATRPLIAGKVPNTPANLEQYLQNPQESDPANTMPNLGITPSDARDLTAFLWTLK